MTKIEKIAIIWLSILTLFVLWITFAPQFENYFWAIARGSSTYTYSCHNSGAIVRGEPDLSWDWINMRLEVSSRMVGECPDE